MLGRLTTETLLDELGVAHSLVYADVTMRTEVTLTTGHVTAISLNHLPIDDASLPTWARMLKPMMRRGGVLALLGKPDGDEKGATSVSKPSGCCSKGRTIPSSASFLLGV